MSTMEMKLEQVWGSTALGFCKQCGMAMSATDCTHDNPAPWAELNVQERALVRLQAIRHAKANRSTGKVFTVAS